mmetsp:Transcript_18292/g.33994  ORF Transcript_18292/g.33994 Transcript_18292/m.33994 type:complete len:113 (-) Transcript_18292:345-683(-)
MFSSNKDTWAVAHLATQEPEAEPYLHDDWDGSTLASTPSMTRGCATILRNRGEPSDIIISVERRISMSERVLKKFWKLLRTLFERVMSKSFSSGISNTSTEQPSLGVMGVIV